MNWKTISLVTLFALAGQLNAQHGLHISGFVDASITIPTDSLTNLGFSFDVVGLDVEKELAKGVHVQADLGFFQEHGQPIAEVEQAFVSFKMFNVKGVATPVFTLGQFNAPIGFELLDPPDMYQFSHSLVFDNALPTNLSGLSISQTLLGGFDVVMYLANGWDVNVNEDGKLIFGVRVGFEHDKGIAAGLSAIQNDNDDALVLDLDATVTMVPNLTIGLEFNQWLGKTFEDNATTEMGWLVMLNYGISDFGITFRQDAWGKSSSTTFSPSYGIADGAGMLF